MFIRKLLIQLLGFEKYLGFISYVFLKTFQAKFFLKEHYQVRFLSQLVKDGDFCIDIGANLGYFTIPLSQYVGTSGKVWAVEPVAMFREILLRNVAYFGKNNVQVLPYALGETDGKKIQMGTPKVEGVIRHGRTQVLEEDSQENVSVSHEVEMMTPETLFLNIERLDFIKCDVEGYELHIIPHFLSIIEKFKPTIEIEIGPKENKQQIINWLKPMGYSVFYLEKETSKLKPFDLEMGEVEELYFVSKN